MRCDDLRVPVVEVGQRCYAALEEYTTKLAGCSDADEVEPERLNAGDIAEPIVACSYVVHDWREREWLSIQRHALPLP